MPAIRAGLSPPRVPVPTAVLRDAPPWLSAEEIAARLECSVRTARRRLLAWHGDRAVDVKREATDSRKWRYLAERDSLAAYLRGGYFAP